MDYRRVLIVFLKTESLGSSLGLWCKQHLSTGWICFCLVSRALALQLCPISICFSLGQSRVCVCVNVYVLKQGRMLGHIHISKGNKYCVSCGGSGLHPSTWETEAEGSAGVWSHHRAFRSSKGSSMIQYHPKERVKGDEIFLTLEGIPERNS